MYRYPKIIALVISAAFVGCGGGDGGDADAAPETGTRAAAVPTVDPEIAATIGGRVLLDGAPALDQAIDMSDEPACEDKYGADGPMTETVVGAEGRLGNVFVYVKEGLEGDFPAAEDPVVLDQEGCRYHPHVLGIQVGQSLLIRNDDPLLHNINAQPTVNRGFNVSQPQAGMESTRRFKAPEVMIPVKCDVHGWMSAYIGVLDHPYFAVSGEDGSFTISSLPPGEYVLEAWHELYGTATQTVTVGASETVDVTFEFSADVARGSTVPLGTPLDPHTGRSTGSRAAAR